MIQRKQVQISMYPRDLARLSKLVERDRRKWGGKPDRSRTVNQLIRVAADALEREGSNQNKTPASQSSD